MQGKQVGSFDREQYRELNRSRYDDARSVFEGARARLESRPSFKGIKEEPPKYGEKPKPTINDVTVSRSPTGVALKTNAFSAPAPDAKPIKIKPSPSRANTIDTPPRPRVAVSASTYVREVQFTEPVSKAPVSQKTPIVAPPVVAPPVVATPVSQTPRGHGVVTLYDGSRVISYQVAKAIGITLPCTLADMRVTQFDTLHAARMSEIDNDILEFAKLNQ